MPVCGIMPREHRITVENLKNQKEMLDKLDNLDKKILNIVVDNARIPSKDIAAQCGVSRAAIHQRLQRLQEMKVITGSGYTVDPHKLGYNTCTYIGIKLEKGSMYREVARELSKIPEVVECHFTTGPYSMLVKTYAYDNQHLMQLLNDKIQHIAGVTETETMISLEQSMHRQIHVEVPEGITRRRKSRKKAVEA